MTASRIALLIGGPSSHHSISRAVADDILDARLQDTTAIQPVLLTPQGQWRMYPSSLGYSADTPQQVFGPNEILTQLPYLFDAALITLTGPYVGDGPLQRMLDRAGMPYQGTGPRASGRVWDTAALYQALRRVGFQIPSYLAMNRTEWVVARGRKLRQIIAAMGTSLVVRSNNPMAQQDIIISSPAQLADAIEELSVTHDRCIIQRRLAGVFARVGLIETAAGLVPGQVVTQSGQSISPQASLALQRVALKIHQALNLRDYSMIELTIAHGRIWVDSIETLPELSRSSAFTASLTALGWSYEELINHLISRALSRPEVIELHQSL